MLDLGDEYGSNEAAGVEGVWIPLRDDASIKLARLGNPEASKAYRKIPRAVRMRLESTGVSDEIVRDFIVAFLADNIVKDWKNLIDGGKSVLYSHENAVLMMKKHRRFREKVWELTNDEEEFNVEEEMDAKNLPAPSIGS